MENDYTWKESVARVVLRLVELTGVAEFTIEQVYHFEADLQGQFPENRHVREKMRQSLQKLVADGILLRSSRGRYQLNLETQELEITTSAAIESGAPAPSAEYHKSNAKSLPVGSQFPASAKRIVTVRLRSTLLAIELKRRYEYKCQVCNYAVPLRAPVVYAEGHHQRPLGNGHNGPDVADNILVLCPNHHTMFDAGAAGVEPDTLRIVHHQAGVFRDSQSLILQDWHHLAAEHIAFHFDHIFTAYY